MSKENRCGNCRFYDGDHCRRHPPQPRAAWHFSLIAMLQAIALAQLKIAGVPEGIFPKTDLDPHDRSDVDAMVFHEVTEQYEGDCEFPSVKEDDWCGEWKADDNRFGVFHSGGLRVRADEWASKEAERAAILAKEKAS